MNTLTKSIVVIAIGVSFSLPAMADTTFEKEKIKTLPTAKELKKPNNSNGCLNCPQKSGMNENNKKKPLTAADLKKIMHGKGMNEQRSATHSSGKDNKRIPKNLNINKNKDNGGFEKAKSQTLPSASTLKRKPVKKTNSKEPS